MKFRFFLCQDAPFQRIFNRKSPPCAAKTQKAIEIRAKSQKNSAKSEKTTQVGRNRAKRKRTAAKRLTAGYSPKTNQLGRGLAITDKVAIYRLFHVKQSKKQINILFHVKHLGLTAATALCNSKI